MHTIKYPILANIIPFWLDLQEWNWFAKSKKKFQNTHHINNGSTSGMHLMQDLFDQTIIDRRNVRETFLETVMGFAITFAEPWRTEIISFSFKYLTGLFSSNSQQSFCLSKHHRASGFGMFEISPI